VAIWPDGIFTNNAILVLLRSFGTDGYRSVRYAAITPVALDFVERGVGQFEEFQGRAPVAGKSDRRQY